MPKWFVVVCALASNNTINIVMKQFRATVRASGVVVTTVVHADNVNFAIKILQALFGVGNVISIPTEI
jgi:membrane-associated PAP2 superfamily phosphatase